MNRVCFWFPVLAFLAVLAALAVVGAVARGDDELVRLTKALEAQNAAPEKPADPFGHDNHVSGPYRVYRMPSAEGVWWWIVSNKSYPTMTDTNRFHTREEAQAEADRFNEAGKNSAGNKTSCGCSGRGDCTCDYDSCPCLKCEAPTPPWKASGPKVGDTDGEGFTYRWSDQYRAYGWYKLVDPPPAPVTYYAPPPTFFQAAPRFFGGGGGGNCGPGG